MFRETVEDLKASYIKTPSRKEKKQIVNKIVRDIKARKGRFLNKLDKNKIRSLGLNHENLYEIVPDSVALEKTKQAIRYVHYKKEPASGIKKSASFNSEKSFSSEDSQASSSSSTEMEEQDKVTGPAHEASAQPTMPASDQAKVVSPVSPSSVLNLHPGGMPPAPSIAGAPLTGIHPAVLAMLRTDNANALANLALLTALSSGGLNLHPTVFSLLLAQSASQASLALARDMEAATNLSNLPKSVSPPAMVATNPVSKPTKKVSPSA